jgi:hypothetical protein
MRVAAQVSLDKFANEGASVAATRRERLKAVRSYSVDVYEARSTNSNCGDNAMLSSDVCFYPFKTTNRRL